MATGIVHDPKMEEYYCLWDETYCENPERLRSVMERCEELGLLQRCEQLPSRKAEFAELSSCHSPQLLDILRKSASMTKEELMKLSANYDCAYFHQNSWEAAQLAAGGAIDLTMGVVEGRIKNGMALVRPPGHHAMRDDSCGYCYVNNIALSARAALDRGVERILIVDWDVHHGQGTQREFYKDNRVLYVSIHRFEFGFWWPSLQESDHNFIGEGEGKGYNVNIPLNTIGNTDTDYLAAWQSVVLPVAYEFDPQLVLVSAGFDPAIGCPEGEQNVSPACFAHFTRSLMGLAGGRVCALLEGGYFPPSLAEGAALTLRSLLGEPVPNLPYPLEDKPRQEMMDSLRNVRISLAPFWSCFSGWKDKELAENKWVGPPEPLIPPYDIMCPTPPRAPETEQHFRELVAGIRDRTKLVQFPKKLCVRNEVKTDLDSETVVTFPTEEEVRSAFIQRQTQVAVLQKMPQLGGDGMKYCILDFSGEDKDKDGMENVLYIDCSTLLKSPLEIFEILLPAVYRHDSEFFVVRGIHQVDKDNIFVVKRVFHMIACLAQGRIAVCESGEHLFDIIDVFC